MSTLTNKELVALIADLERQGCKTAKTKNGTRLMFPDGTSTVVHWTESDSRAVLNTRSRVLRAGLTWLFDGPEGGAKSKLALSPERRDHLVQTIQDAVGPVTVAEIARLASVSEPTARKYMLEYSFEQRTRGAWFRKSDAPEHPEIEAARALVADKPELLPEAEIAPEVATPAPLTTEERIVLDSHDSWVVTTPADLQEMADKMGLEIEVRVWRK